MEPTEIRRIVSDIDADNSGEIDLDEFLTYMAKFLGRSKQPESRRAESPKAALRRVRSAEDVADEEAAAAEALRAYQLGKKKRLKATKKKAKKKKKPKKKKAAAQSVAPAAEPDAAPEAKDAAEGAAEDVAKAPQSPIDVGAPPQAQAQGGAVAENEGKSEVAVPV